MGNFISLAGVNPPSDRPKVDLLDSVLPSQGALLLLEPGHPIIGLDAALANGVTVPNVAHEQAAAMIGSGTAASLGGTLSIVGMSGADGLMERSGKGGVHAIISQRSDMATGHYGRLEVKDPIKQYILANPTHDYGISMALRTTRAPRIATSPAVNLLRRLLFADSGSIAANYLAHFRTTNNTGISEAAGNSPSDTYPDNQQGTAQYIGNVRTDHAPVPGPRRFALGVNAVTGTIPNLGAFAARVGWGPGGIGGNNEWVSPSATPNQDHPSWVLYWLYIEDLTVSGRSWAQFEAADKAKYNDQMLSVGGRYYGDTYTDPATIA